MKRFRKYYFCGWPLDEVFRLEFFRRYENFSDVGFCCVVSAIVMATLKDCVSARIVRGRSRVHNSYFHSWVEVRWKGNWYAVDPLWIKGAVAVPRRVFYRDLELDVTYICRHETFWSWRFCKVFEYNLQKAQTSHIWIELMDLFCPSLYDRRLGIDEERMAKVWLSPEMGKKLLPLPHETAIVSNRVIAEYMTRPTRLRPKAHTIRKTVHEQRLMNRALNMLYSFAPPPD